MSEQINCNACDDLREYAPDFVQNGVTNTVCNSMKNDTGINPAATVTHNDCEDLDTVNDCLVGRMDGELEAYDQCDWKKFMHKFIPNLYNLLKLMICAICGLWTNIHSLWSTVQNICKLQEATLQHPVYQYGVLPNGVSSRRGGTLGLKGGTAILVARPKSELTDSVWTMQNVGIRYGKLNAISCTTGSCVRHEWIAPDIIAYKFNQVPAYDDVLWYCSESVAKNTFGMTDEHWDAKVANPVGWATDFSTGNALINVAIGVWNGRFEMRLRGVVGATYAELNGKIIQAPADQAERMYRFPC